MQTETTALPATFSPRQRKELFDEIVMLYDLADEVLAAVMNDGIVKNRSTQMEIAGPFVKTVTNSADILSGLFTEVACKNRPISPELQQTIEGAFRDIFIALKEFSDQVDTKLIQGAEKKW